MRTTTDTHKPEHHNDEHGIMYTSVNGYMKDTRNRWEKREKEKTDSRFNLNHHLQSNIMPPQSVKDRQGEEIHQGDWVVGRFAPESRQGEVCHFELITHTLELTAL